MREVGIEELGKLYECLEALAKHHNQVSTYFKGCYPLTPIEQTIKRFEDDLGQGKSSIAVIEDDDRVVGFCKINVDGTAGTLEYLIVLGEERGKGYGAALMGWALDSFRKLQVKQVEVKVVYGNEAMGLYKKFGFKEKSVVLGLNL